MSRFKWYRRLRGGVWIKWNDCGWTREPYLTSLAALPAWCKPCKSILGSSFSIDGVEDYT